MAVVSHTTEDIRLLARLMRAEAEGEGKLGMLMVGNVGVNRVVGNCLDFKKIRSLRDMVFQKPGGYEAVDKPYFFQRAREAEIKLARQVIKGWKYHPASYSLWFFKPSGSCPAQWFNQWNVGRHKSHCFYAPDQSDCPQIYY
ncbi:MAG TPA: cell wall hydrolase [Bacillus bacterium]|nr:cell wall hydrolase [Bacillus sp. (in: firmicutes)]